MTELEAAIEYWNNKAINVDMDEWELINFNGLILNRKNSEFYRL